MSSRVRGRARFIALVSVVSAMGVSLRLGKHAVLGSLQFFNAPLFSAMLAGYLGGPSAGLAAGVMVFTITDLVIGLGPWTLVNSILAGLIGAAWGVVRLEGMAEVFTAAFLSSFAYDVLSSLLLYAAFYYDLWTALLYALVGLYMPVGGGYLVGVGPLTEFVTSGLTAVAVHRLKNLRAAP